VKALALVPTDTLFFRDGTPFASDSASQADVGGLFPPHPATVAGALRAALARARGWDGHGRWPEELDEVLGNGPDDLGRLSLTGPFVTRDGEPLFPMPRHVLGNGAGIDWKPRTLLRPGAPVACDLGDAVRLPEPEPKGDPHELRPPDDAWLTRAGLRDVLAGQLPTPDALVRSDELWQEERRIGLERDRRTRAAKEGQLYSARHVRPAPGVALGVRIDGLPDDWVLPDGALVPLGGEARVAEVARWDGELNLGDVGDDASAAGRRIALVALTPLDLEADVCTGRAPIGAPGGARVVSACLDRPGRIGGWDSLARRPTPMRSVLPAGSVLFCESDDPAAASAATKNGSLLRLGARTPWGYGLAALGRWPGSSETTT